MRVNVRGITWAMGWLILAVGPVPALAQPAREAPAELHGTWSAIQAQRDGKGAGDVVGHRLSFSGHSFQIRSRNGQPLYRGTFRVDPGTQPATIDFEHTDGTLKGTAWKGIYALDGDTLRICDNAADPTKGRPTTFTAAAGSGHVAITFERASGGRP